MHRTTTAASAASVRDKGWSDQHGIPFAEGSTTYPPSRRYQAPNMMLPSNPPNQRGGSVVRDQPGIWVRSSSTSPKDRCSPHGSCPWSPCPRRAAGNDCSVASRPSEGDDESGHAALLDPSTSEATEEAPQVDVERFTKPFHLFLFSGETNLLKVFKIAH